MTDPIKAKIQELCPDVMELKFGCEVLDEVGVKERVMWAMEYDVKLDGTAVAIPISSLKQILGSSITLAVVLRAISKTCAGFVILSSNGWLTMHGKGSVLWDFTKNYDDQEQSVKDFIGSLLTRHVSTSK